jgi:hypothetical protein
MSHTATVEPGPSRADLAAIDAEWPDIAAELAALEAEIRSISSAVA